MPPLRTLVRPWQARQHTIASIFVSRLLSLSACRLDAQGRSCHGHVTSGESSILRSASNETCGQDVDIFGESHVMHSAPGNDGFELKFCRPDATRLVDLQACKQHVKIPKLQTCKQHALSSHIYPSASQDASPDVRSAPMVQTHTTQGLETFRSAVPQTLKPCMRQNALKRRSHDAALYACNADDSALAPDTKCLELHQKLSLLESEHVSLCNVKIIGKLRAFKSTSFEHLVAVLKVLKELLGSGKKACQALAMNPALLSQPIEHLEQKLKVMADFEITETVLRKLCTHKNILQVKLESFHKTLSFLKEIGLSVEGRNRLLCRQCAWLSSEGSILQILDFLTNLGMTRDKILRHQLGFSVNEFIRAIYHGVPRLSMETLQTKIKFLKDEGFSDSDVHRLISRQPSIIALKSEVVKRKLDFLLCEQKYDMADIVKWPNCLACSLQGRMIPRFKVLEENGLCRVFSLSTILGRSHLNFLKLTKRNGQQKCIFSLP